MTENSTEEKRQTWSDAKWACINMSKILMCLHGRERELIIGVNTNFRHLFEYSVRFNLSMKIATDFRFRKTVLVRDISSI